MAKFPIVDLTQDLTVTQGEDVTIEDEGHFTVHARSHPELVQFEAFIYLATEVVFTIRRPATEFPAGLRDFAGWSLRVFAKRLARIMENVPA